VIISIDDIDAAVAALAERGIAVGDVTVVGNGVRSVPVIDPHGNRIAFGQMPTDV
jgi:predicted enzyme related to lactoylglutathione lyase